MTDPEPVNANSPEIPAPARCDLYLPGHTVHFIQARRSWQDRPSQRAGVLGGIENGVVTVVFDDGERRFRNHEPWRIAAVAEALGPEVVYQERLGLLRFPRPPGTIGGYLFCLADADAPWRECLVRDRAEPMSEADVVEAVLRDGGFMGRVVPPPEARGRR